MFGCVLKGSQRDAKGKPKKNQREAKGTPCNQGLQRCLFAVRALASVYLVARGRFLASRLHVRKPS